MLPTDRQFGWPSFDTFQITSENWKGQSAEWEDWAILLERSWWVHFLSSLIYYYYLFLMSTFDSAGLCRCCHPHLRVLLTSAAVRELPFLHIPGAVEDNCCSLWEGEAQKKHFQQTSVAEVFCFTDRVMVQTEKHRVRLIGKDGLWFLSAARYHSDYLSACSFWMKEGQEMERESASRTLGCSLNTSTFLSCLIFPLFLFFSTMAYIYILITVFWRKLIVCQHPIMWHSCKET